MNIAAPVVAILGKVSGLAHVTIVALVVIAEMLPQALF